MFVTCVSGVTVVTRLTARSHRLLQLGFNSQNKVDIGDAKVGQES